MPQSNLMIKQLSPFNACQPEWRIPAFFNLTMYAVYGTYAGDEGEQVHVSGYLSPGQQLDITNMDASSSANVCITRKWTRKGDKNILTLPTENAPLYLETLGQLMERTKQVDVPFYFDNRAAEYKEDDFKPNDPVSVFALKVTRSLINKLVENNLLAGEFYMHNGSWNAISVNGEKFNHLSLAAMLDELEVLPDVRLSIQTGVVGETLVYINNGRSGTYRWPTYLL